VTLVVRLLVACLAALLALPALAAPASSSEGGPQRLYLVQFASGTGPDAGAGEVRRGGGRVEGVLRRVFPGAVARMSERAASALARNPRVARVEADQVVHAAETQSSPPWGLDRIDQRSLPLSETFSWTANGAGVTAYVVDTGIRADHVDFQDRVEVGHTVIADGRGTGDCNGHGTHVAGTLGGVNYGVAKAVRLVPVRVLDCTGSGTVSGIVQALDWVIGQHEAGTPAVANLSLGSGASLSLDAAVQATIDDGVAVVVAAGNANADACTVSPARVADAVTAGATDQADARASFSNYGTCVDLFGPGVGIASAWYTSTTAQQSLSGTSMATPHVTGAVAALLELEPTLSPAAVAARLVDTGTAGVVTGAGAGSPNRLLWGPLTATAPSAPAAVTATAGDGSAQVSWTAAAAYGSPVTGYTVTSSDGQTSTVSGDSTTTSVSGLTNGTAYTFTVTATNAIGTGPASAASNSVTPAAPTAPSAPATVTATAGDSQAQVSWTAAEPNGSPITGYRVSASPGDRSCATTGALSCTVTGLTNGTAYTFTVTATNAVGSSPVSVASGSVTPLAPPSAPAAPTATAGDTAAGVSWSAPSTDGGSPITGYRVSASPGDRSCATTGALSCTVTGLTNGTAYSFTVNATNAAGSSPSSAASTSVVPAVPPSAPSAPTGVSATSGDSSARVSWTAPADGGRPITGYTVTSSGGQTSTVSSESTTTTVTGLTNGTTYTFTVTATNSVGTSPSSAASGSVTPIAPPGAPAAPMAAAGDMTVAVSWSAPDSDGGSPVTGYRVTASPGDGSCATAGALSCTVTGLTNGTAYTFTVTATNAAGAGPASAVTDTVVPVAPTTAAPPADPPVVSPPPVAPTGPSARSIDAACPVGRVPANRFADVPNGSTHERAISCLVWWEIANGRTATSYAPLAGVTRDAMASFVARTVLEAKPGSLPENPPDAFRDDQGSVHQRAIDQLAAAGIVGGTGGGNYSPSAVVSRGQMARFLANAARHVLGQPLPVDRDLFGDDGTSLFQDDINRVAQAGITGGRADGSYGPTGPVLRDQMGSFLARTLDLFVEKGARLPA
jgi:subtilisin family serine protease